MILPGNKCRNPAHTGNIHLRCTMLVLNAKHDQLSCLDWVLKNVDLVFHFYRNSMNNIGLFYWHLYVKSCMYIINSSISQTTNSTLVLIRMSGKISYSGSLFKRAHGGATGGVPRELCTRNIILIVSYCCTRLSEIAYI